MRVLFLTNVPSPYRVDFFNELGKYVDLTVLFERKAASDREEKWHVSEFANFRGIFLPGIKRGADSAFCPSVIKFLTPRKYDIIVVGGYATPTQILAILYLRLKHIPFVLNADGAFIRNESNLKRSFKRFLISSATWWICSGEYTKKTLVYYGADERRVFTYPFTSVRAAEVLERPPSREEKVRIRKELGINEEQVVLCVGQFIPRKGFDVLIRASKFLPERVGIYIVGGKPTEEYLSLVRQLGVEEKVHFIEFKPKPDLRPYYLASDLFVLPTREDVWGLVINEAMAFGLPVISTEKCIAALEMLGNDCPECIVVTEDSDKLARAIQLVLSDPLKAQEMATRNLAKARVFTIENMAAKHLAIFQEILQA